MKLSVGDIVEGAGLVGVWRAAVTAVREGGFIQAEGSSVWWGPALISRVDG